MSTEPVRISWTISIGYPTAKHRGTWEIDREEWNSMTPAARVDHLEEMYQQELSNVLDGGWNLENADIDDPLVES